MLTESDVHDQRTCQNDRTEGGRAMHVAPQIVEAAKRNGRDNIYGQSKTRFNDRIRAEKVVDLLVTATSPAAERGARELLHQMGRKPWDVLRPVHTSESDPTPPITLGQGQDKYHLRLDARGCVFDVTLKEKDKATIRLSGHEPWMRPGATRSA